MSNDIHILSKGDRWLITRGNYTLDECKNQKQAIETARQRAKRSHANLILHASDGTVSSVEKNQPRQARSAKARVMPSA